MTRREWAGHSFRWDERLARQAYLDGHWVRTTLAHALQQEARRAPDRALIIEGDVLVTAAELERRASALAGYLANRFAPGSVVSFMLPNWHEAAVIYLAATLAGLVAHPVLPSLRAHDLRFMLADVHSRVLFMPSSYRGYDYVGMLESVCERLEQPPEVVVLRGDSGPFTAFAEVASGQPLSAAGLPEVDPDSVRMIMYTSGTTGSPKGVMHSHNSIHALIRQIGQHWRIDRHDRFLVASPISHIGGSIYAFECPLLLGTTAVLMEGWEPDQAVEQMLAHGCTHFAGATPFLTGMLAAARRANTRLPDLKVFICGGASVPPSLIREAVGYFENAAVTRVYGSTEVPVTTVGVPDRDDVQHAAETDGAAGIADIKLVDGRVWARGPQMLVGYVHAGDESDVFDEEGYYHTGDIAQWCDEQYLVIGGRSKDIIIRNGENIAPKEIEDLLLAEPEIAEIAIVGLPDPRTGERACAVIVPAGGASPDLHGIIAMLTGHGVAKFKFPEQIELWSALPKNDAGKVLKHRIRDQLLRQ